jgi:hypothetical protein
LSVSSSPMEPFQHSSTPTDNTRHQDSSRAQPEFKLVVTRDAASRCDTVLESCGQCELLNDLGKEYIKTSESDIYCQLPQDHIMTPRPSIDPPRQGSSRQPFSSNSYLVGSSREFSASPSCGPRVIEQCFSLELVLTKVPRPHSRSLSKRSAEYSKTITRPR